MTNLLKRLCFTAAIFAMLSVPHTIIGQEEVIGFPKDPVSVELIEEETAIQAGHPFWIGIRLKMDDGWHAYWKNPGDAGFPLSIDWLLPEGFEVKAIKWPIPEKFTQNSTIGFGYSHEMTLLAEIVPPPKMASTDAATIAATVRWLVCSDNTCLPGDSEAKLDLPISSQLPEVNEKWHTDFDQARKLLPHAEQSLKVEKHGDSVDLSLIADHAVSKVLFFPEDNDSIDYKVEPVLEQLNDVPHHYLVHLKGGPQTSQLKGVLVLENEGEKEGIDVSLLVEETPPDLAFHGSLILALGFAFLGGMLLNLMPCVLPVISLKVLSFVKMAQENRATIFKHGAMFSLGVLLSFWVIAGALLALQAYGNSVGWGFQLQEPLFVAALAGVLLILSLSLFGVFEAGAIFSSWAGQAVHDRMQSSKGLAASFFSGILATVVATPCTGPFLGSAVGFAVTLPALSAMSIFTSLGLGMAFPYLLLSAFPALLKHVPKPGPWMVTFKEIMGFLMLGTVLWLLWVFGAQTDMLALFAVLAGFVAIAFACWIYGKWVTPLNRKAVRIVASCWALSFAAIGGYAIYQAALPYDSNQIASHAVAQEGWESFSRERLQELQAMGVPVFIDFTAKWCLICQTNHMALSVGEVIEAFAQKGIVKMKADWTKADQVITEELRKFGRNGVPLYLLYGTNSDQPPLVLPQVLTPGVVLEHLEKIN